jgi:glycine/D-amino acid oxidase-like deaminating enzyme
MNPILIVGGGVAGISLAHACANNGIDFRIMDDGKNVCSSIAAGIVNPFSFRRTLLTWNAHPFYQEALKFYQNIDNLLNTQHCVPIYIRRVFSSEEEKIRWEQRFNDSSFEPFMIPFTREDENYPPFGSGRIKGFWIDANNFIRNNQRYFEAQGRLLNEGFSKEDFSALDTVYKGMRFSKVIFALGYRNRALPWFQDIPVQSTQGEVLTVSWNNNNSSTSIHRKVYALPIRPRVFKIGATYKWHTEALEPTQAAREELLEKFRIISCDEVQVINHEAGIRPTSPDRRPFIGEHKEYKSLCIFNGLGTKGYLTAPPLAQRFVQAFSIDGKKDPTTFPYRFKPS